MKKCSQCNSVYEDDVRFCLDDGTELVRETFVLPSEDENFEAETIVRHDPIIVDMSSQNLPTERIVYQTPPVETVIIQKSAKRKNPMIFLVLGLVLGGGLVLGTLLLARNFYQKDNTSSVKITQTSDTNSNKPVKISPTETPIDIQELSQKHEARTDAEEDEFNGRVIASNAYVRTLPSRSADETDVLPIDDRVNIERRENDNSPWYFITCEHGTSGWMHGNTIEYTK